MAHPLNESLWRQLTEQITQTMGEWRQLHPKATLREIETELDAHLAQARARMLEDLALSSSAACWQESARLLCPTCPQCGTPLDDRGSHPRTLLTDGDQQLLLERSYGVCPTCNVGLFPPR